jgi:hypothetical protein
VRRRQRATEDVDTASNIPSQSRIDVTACGQFADGGLCVGRRDGGVERRDPCVPTASGPAQFVRYAGWVREMELIGCVEADDVL